MQRDLALCRLPHHQARWQACRLACWACWGLRPALPHRRAPRPAGALALLCGLAPPHTFVLARRNVASSRRCPARRGRRVSDGDTPADAAPSDSNFAAADSAWDGHADAIQGADLDAGASHACGTCRCNSDSPSDCSVGGTSGTSRKTVGPSLIINDGRHEFLQGRSASPRFDSGSSSHVGPNFANSSTGIAADRARR